MMPSRPVVTILGIFTALGFLGGLASSLLQSPVYEAITLIEIVPTSGESPERVVGNQVEVIQSAGLLSKVSTQLELPQKWGVRDNQAILRIQQSIDAVQIRDTDLIETTVRDESAADCQRIAETLIDSYSDMRRATHKEQSEVALQQLQESIKSQEAKTTEKREILANFISGGAHKKSNLKRLVELQQKRFQLENQLENLLRLEDDMLLAYATSIDVPENITESLYPEYLDAKLKYGSLSRGGLGEQHPVLVEQRVIIDAMASDLNEGVVSLRVTLLAELEDIKKEESEVSPPLPPEPDHAGLMLLLHYPSGAVDQPFDAARLEFESSQRHLEDLKSELVTAELASRIQSDPVLIHSPATVLEKPVSPDIPRKLALGSITGLLIGLLVALPTARHLHRQTEITSA